LDCESLYGRDGIYGYTASQEFPDNPERFATLSRAAFAVCRTIGWIPEVMHANDWPTALVPVYLNTIEKNSEFHDTTSILTIHNLGYQGIYSQDHFLRSGLGGNIIMGQGLSTMGISIF